MARCDVVVLHDFFVDRILLSDQLVDLLRSVELKGVQGGGGLHGVPQLETRGGNAVNLASALGRLGTSTYLITHTDQLHRKLLTDGFRGLSVRLSVKRLEPGLTVAFEGEMELGRVNVMLGHLGGAGDFPPSLLNGRDWDALRQSRVICVVNWAANKHGTEMVSEIRRRVGKGAVFLDPADVRDRVESYGEFLAAVRKQSLIDWLSTNEFEAKVTAKLLGLRTERLDVLCRQVASELGIRFDLHTEKASFTSEGDEVFSHRIRRVTPRVLTGAGDVWDAASVHFFLAGANAERRIELADRAAKLYLLSEGRSSPTEREVTLLLEHS